MVKSIGRHPLNVDLPPLLQPSRVLLVFQPLLLLALRQVGVPVGLLQVGLSIALRQGKNRLLAATGLTWLAAKAVPIAKAAATLTKNFFIFEPLFLNSNSILSLLL